MYFVFLACTVRRVKVYKSSQSIKIIIDCVRVTIIMTRTVSTSITAVVLYFIVLIVVLLSFCAQKKESARKKKEKANIFLKVLFVSCIFFFFFNFFGIIAVLSICTKWEIWPQ